MKKIFLLIGLALLITSCNHDESDSKQTVTALATTGITLNGIKENDAKTWIDNFEKSMADDAEPKIVNYILKKPMVMQIVDLLNKERTEGLRIYFGKKDPKSKDVILILVSSRYYGTDQTGQKKFKDYYTHNTSHTLFGTGINKDIEVFEKPASTQLNNGAVLYNVSGASRPGTCFSVTLDNYIDRGFAEEIIGKFGGHSINTRAVWFSASTLYTMAKEQNCTGIRVYLATYPSDYHTVEYQNRDTFVLTTVETEKYTDYFDCERSFLLNKDAKRMMWDPMNNGSLCPNNCN